MHEWKSEISEVRNSSFQIESNRKSKIVKTPMICLHMWKTTEILKNLSAVVHTAKVTSVQN